MGSHIETSTDAASGGRGLHLRPTGPQPLASRLGTESQVAQWLTLSRHITGVELVPAAVTFRHRAPSSVAAHRRFFGRAPRFEASRAGLWFHEADLRRPTLQPDPGLHALLLRKASEELAALPTESGLAPQVQRQIVELLPSGAPSIDVVARRLGMGARTLRRRLAVEDSSFRSLVDDARRGLADRYLAEPTLSSVEIAFLLGFSDERAFRRAYKRWTGRSPRRRR